MPWLDALGLPVRYLDGVGNRGAHYGANEPAWNSRGDVRAFLARALAP